MSKKIDIGGLYVRKTDGDICVIIECGDVIFLGKTISECIVFAICASKNQPDYIGKRFLQPDKKIFLKCWGKLK